MNVLGAGTPQSLQGDAALRLAIDHAEPLRRIGNHDIVGDAEFRDQG